MNFIRKLNNKKYLTVIIYINIIMFIVVNILITMYFLFGLTKDIELQKVLLNNLGVAASLKTLIQKPWTLITHMFTHFNLFHMCFNLCYLYFGGKIFIDYLSECNLFSTYIMGGLIGFLIYIISLNIFPFFDSINNNTIALGASSSALAILVASATYMPNLPIKILSLGSVKLKYIAVMLIIIDFISITKGNAGGHIAHIGGALYGWTYIYMKQKNVNLGYFIDQIILIFSTETKIISKKENDYEYNARKKKEQKKIDMILDKISSSGYDSLSEKEKKILLEQK